MPSTAYHIRGLIKAAGWMKAGEIVLRRVFRRPGVVVVRVRGHRLEVRPADSDLFVLSQIFGWEEYAVEPDRLGDLRQIAAQWAAAGQKALIVDGGANVGYAALYFADLFPGAHVLSIEPDRASYEILARHTAGHPRITAVHAALWSHENGLALRSTDSGCWGRQTSEGTGTPSKRLDALVASIPDARPLVIKLDIEGAEREVVASCPATFAAAKCIMIEPHDFQNRGAACLAPLYRVVADGRFDTILNGENLLLFAPA